MKLVLYNNPNEIVVKMKVRVYCGCTAGRFGLLGNSVRINAGQFLSASSSVAHFAKISSLSDSSRFVICKLIPEATIPENEIQLDTWMLSYLKVIETDIVMLEKLDADIEVASEVWLSLTDVEGGGELNIPNSISQILQDGQIDFAALVGRQLNHFPVCVQSRLSVEVLGRLKILTVDKFQCSTVEIEPVGLLSCNTKIHYVHKEESSCSNNSKANSIENGIAYWKSRAENFGFCGYDEIMEELFLHTVAIDDNNTFLKHVSSKGFLVSGVTGVGKTTLLNAFSNELMFQQNHSNSSFKVVTFSGPSLKIDLNSNNFSSDSLFWSNALKIDSQNYEKLVVIIDDIDSLFVKNSDKHSSSVLNLLINGIPSKWGVLPVIVVGSVNSSANIPLSWQRPGCFDRVFKMNVPSEKIREKMLMQLLPNHLSPHMEVSLMNEPNLNLEERLGKLSISNDNLDKVRSDFASRLAYITGGYVVCDLSKICRQAQVNSMINSKLKNAATCAVRWEDLLKAHAVIKPSQLQQLDVKSSSFSYTWDKFGGYDLLRKRLLQLVNCQFNKSTLLEGLGVEPVSGILLYGPSGCGKSLLANVLAAESNANFVSVKSSELLSKYLGESERAIRALFARARAASPCILFFDEIDSIAQQRDFAGGSSEGTGSVQSRVLSTFLNEMDGVEMQTSNILVIAATNRLNSMDAALIRPGRIDQSLEVGYPSKSDCLDILKVHTKKMPLDNNVDFEEIAGSDVISPFSGADLSAICKEAAMNALRENIDSTIVSARHFSQAKEHRIQQMNNARK